MQAMATTGALGALVAAALGTAVPAAAQDGDAAAELAEVEAALDALGERVQRLRDVSDISKLQRSYGYYVDKAQWHDVRDLFAENGTLEIGGRGVFIGQERVFEYLETGMGPVGPTEGQLIDHQQFQGIVTIGPTARRPRGAGRRSSWASPAGATRRTRTTT